VLLGRHTLSPTHIHAPETAEELFGLYHPLTHNLFHILTHTRGAAAEGRFGMTAEDIVACPTKKETYIF